MSEDREALRARSAFSSAIGRAYDELLDESVALRAENERMRTQVAAVEKLHAAWAVLAGQGRWLNDYQRGLLAAADSIRAALDGVALDTPEES